MRLIGILLGSLVVSWSIAAVQLEAKPENSADDPSAAIIDLLKQSHDQDQSVAISTRWHLLRMQTQAILPFDANLARTWG
jgi:hypothetical protein